MPGNGHAGPDRRRRQPAAIHAGRCASHDFADPVVGLAPVLRRFVAPALILFERAPASSGGPTSAACATGMPIIDVYANQRCNPENGACANCTARRKKNVQHDEPRKHAASLPRSESTDFNASQHGAPSARANSGEKGRGGRSGPSGMKPLNAVAGVGVKRCRSGMMTTLSVTEPGSADASAHAAQCLQSCWAGGLSVVPPRGSPPSSRRQRVRNVQPSIDAEANACSGRASISSSRRNREIGRARGSVDQKPGAAQETAAGPFGSPSASAVSMNAACAARSAPRRA